MPVSHHGRVISLSDTSSSAVDRNNFNPEEVATAIAFLRRCRLTRSRAARLSSYGLKHYAERWGKAAGMAPYVTNGELIAAALYLGFPVEFNTTCVNALVGVNKLQLRKLTHTEWSASIGRRRGRY
jgi:hypothetical protein